MFLAFFLNIGNRCRIFRIFTQNFVNGKCSPVKTELHFAETEGTLLCRKLDAAGIAPQICLVLELIQVQYYKKC